MTSLCADCDTPLPPNAPCPNEPQHAADFEVVQQVARVLAEHLHGTFLGSLMEVWTTCTCGERIDATFGDGRSTAEVFKANWSNHLAHALAAANLLTSAPVSTPAAGADHLPLGCSPTPETARRPGG